MEEIKFLQDGEIERVYAADPHNPGDQVIIGGNIPTTSYLSDYLLDLYYAAVGDDVALEFNPEPRLRHEAVDYILRRYVILDLFDTVFELIE
jgi:hypothetical protein